MLFLVPLAEGAVALAESTAVRAVAVEAGEALIAAETRQAVMTAVTTEGRALASSLATAEGRAALYESVSKGASDLVSKGAALTTEEWAAVSQTAKEWAASAAKKYMAFEAAEFAWDQMSDKVTEMAMEKLVNYFADGQVDMSALQDFAQKAAEFGMEENLGKDVRSLLGELQNGEVSPDALNELAGSLAMAGKAMPDKIEPAHDLARQAEGLAQLQTLAHHAKAEGHTQGHASSDTLSALLETLDTVKAQASPQAQDSLDNARDSVREALADPKRDTVEDALSEVSTASDSALRRLVEETSYLAADLQADTEIKKDALAEAIDTLLPAIVETNDLAFERNDAQLLAAKDELSPAEPGGAELGL